MIVQIIMKTIKDSYEYYKKKEDKDFVDYKTYKTISFSYNKFLIEKVLEGEEVTLPNRLGSLYIAGKKLKIKFDKDNNPIGLPPNWVKTKKLWESSPEAKKKKQLVYCTNDHSDGIRYRYMWSKYRVFAENKMLYSLLLSRTNKRLLYKNILNNKDYTLFNERKQVN